MLKIKINDFRQKIVQLDSFYFNPNESTYEKILVFVLRHLVMDMKVLV